MELSCEKQSAFFFLLEGVRLNVPVDTPLVTLEAVDADADAPPVHYSLLGAEFHRSSGSDMGVPEDTPIFSLNEKMGELHTAASLAPFADGIFTLIIGANNSDDENRGTNTTVKVGQKINFDTFGQYVRFLNSKLIK